MPIFPGRLRQPLLAFLPFLLALTDHSTEAFVLPSWAPRPLRTIAAATSATAVQETAHSTISNVVDDEEQLSQLRLVDLKAVCKERGLRVGGTKAVLIQRILDQHDRDLKGDNDSDDDATTAVSTAVVHVFGHGNIDLHQLKVKELKDECRGRGLKVGGSKAVLVQRILKHEDEKKQRDKNMDGTVATVATEGMTVPKQRHHHRQQPVKKAFETPPTVVDVTTNGSVDDKKKGDGTSTTATSATISATAAAATTTTAKDTIVPKHQHQQLDNIVVEKPPAINEVINGKSVDSSSTVAPLQEAPKEKQMKQPSVDIAEKVTSDKASTKTSSDNDGEADDATVTSLVGDVFELVSLLAKKALTDQSLLPETMKEQGQEQQGEETKKMLEKELQQTQRQAEERARLAAQQRLERQKQGEMARQLAETERKRRQAKQEAEIRRLQGKMESDAIAAAKKIEQEREAMAAKIHAQELAAQQRIRDQAAHAARLLQQRKQPRPQKNEGISLVVQSKEPQVARTKDDSPGMVNEQRKTRPTEKENQGQSQLEIEAIAAARKEREEQAAHAARRKAIKRTDIDNTKDAERSADDEQEKGSDKIDMPTATPLNPFASWFSGKSSAPANTQSQQNKTSTINKKTDECLDCNVESSTSEKRVEPARVTVKQEENRQAHVFKTFASMFGVEPASSNTTTEAKVEESKEMGTVDTSDDEFGIVKPSFSSPRNLRLKKREGQPKEKEGAPSDNQSIEQEKTQNKVIGKVTGEIDRKNPIVKPSFSTPRAQLSKRRATLKDGGTAVNQTSKQTQGAPAIKDDDEVPVMGSASEAKLPVLFNYNPFASLGRPWKVPSEKKMKPASKTATELEGPVTDGRATTNKDEDTTESVAEKEGTLSIAKPSKLTAQKTTKKKAQELAQTRALKENERRRRQAKQEAAIKNRQEELEQEAIAMAKRDAEAHAARLRALHVSSHSNADFDDDIIGLKKEDEKDEESRKEQKLLKTKNPFESLFVATRW